MILRVHHPELPVATVGYAADWTVSQLRAPAQNIADRIETMLAQLGSVADAARILPVHYASLQKFPTSTNRWAILTDAPSTIRPLTAAAIHKPKHIANPSKTRPRALSTGRLHDRGSTLAVMFL